MEPLGVLLLHGFSSSLDTVNGLCPYLEKANLPYRMPVLRGHGATPEALAGVQARDWVDDATAALRDLRHDVDSVVVVGLSMGGLVALTLAMEQPERLTGVVTLAAALRFCDRLAPLAQYLYPVMRRTKMPPVPSDESYLSTNYTWVPTPSFVELYRFGRDVERRLAEVRVPILVIGTRHDRVVRPESAEIIYRGVSSSEKELRMFERSGHEMLQAREREDVYAAVMAFVGQRRALLQETA